MASIGKIIGVNGNLIRVKFGFRVKLDGGKVTHEFTEAAMADALSALLRPQLSRVVNAAAQAK